jgi:ribosome-binding factor A
MVSITDVEVSEDFSYATVYISALESPEEALAFLEKQLPTLRRSLGKIHRSRVPEIRFRIDPRIDRGGRVDDLLEQEQGEA